MFGGAARATYRLHEALLRAGVESQMLVQSKTGSDKEVFSNFSKHTKGLVFLRQIFDNIPVLFYRKREKNIFSTAWVPSIGLLKMINRSNADIVHLHWIAGGMLRIEELTKINKPVVWSLLDMWAFTGGCHYDNYCNKYTHNCGACPILGSNKVNDLSKKNYNRKNKTYSKIKELKIIGHSNWLAESAKKSSLLYKKEIRNISSTIDVNFFSPILKNTARKDLQLPQEKKLILFGAMGATSDTRKGFKELSEALRLLNIQEIELVVFGAKEPDNSPDFNFKAHYLGKLSDDESLRSLYSAVDVTVLPSLQENMSNIVLESLSCATPVVAFNIGGNPDMIDHLYNGYLAKPFETEDLAKGIMWVLNHKNPDELSYNAREKVLKNFDYCVVAQKYIDLYNEVLHNKSKY